MSRIISNIPSALHTHPHTVFHNEDMEIVKSYKIELDDVEEYETSESESSTSYNQNDCQTSYDKVT